MEVHAEPCVGDKEWRFMLNHVKKKGMVVHAEPYVEIRNGGSC